MTTDGCGSPLEQERRQSRGGLGDEHAVHALRAGPELAAQPGGAEAEAPGEAGREVGAASGSPASAAIDQLLELGARDVIRILGGPRRARP